MVSESFKYFISLLFAGTIVSAGTFHSPTEDQELRVNQPFNFTWETTRYFKEAPENVTVLLTSGKFVTNRGGHRLIHEMPYGEYDGVNAIYQAELSASLSYGGQLGAYQLVVLENFRGYGSEGFAFYTQDVTLVA